MLAFPALSEAKIDSIITLPGGGNGEVQFKNGSRFDGDPNFKYSSTTYRIILSSGGIQFSDGSVQVSSAIGGGIGDTVSLSSITATGDYSGGGDALFVDGTLVVHDSLWVPGSGGASIAETVTIYGGAPRLEMRAPDKSGEHSLFTQSGMSDNIFNYLPVAHGSIGSALTLGPGTGDASEQYWYWNPQLSTSGVILNQSSLQSGATFYVSSGTVKGQFLVTDSELSRNLSIYPDPTFGFGGFVHFVQPAEVFASAGPYRIVVSTLSALPSATDGRQSNLLFFPPGNATYPDGAIRFGFGNSVALSMDPTVVEIGSALTVGGQSVCLEDGTDCPAGSGGGGSAAIFTTSGTSGGFVNTISSPTGGFVAHQDQFILTKTGSSTSFWELNLSSITAQGNNLSTTFVTHSSIATTSYLPTSVAADTYVTQSSIAATSYLPTSVAAATYVTQSSIAATSYLPTSVFYSSAANTYPTISTVSGNYLLKSSASLTYIPYVTFNSSAANTYPTISTVSGNYLLKSSASATYLWQPTFNSSASVTYINTAGDSYTGVHDAGGATSLEIPNGTGPTVDTTGEIGLDTTAGQLLWFDGINANVVPSTMSQHMTIESPAVGDYPFFFRVDRAVTVTRAVCISSASTSASIQIDECDGNGVNCAAINTAAACTTTNTQLAVTNSAIDAGDRIRVKVTAVSGTPGWVGVDLYYRETRQ